MTERKHTQAFFDGIKQGKTCSEIAREFGVCRLTVIRNLKVAGLPTSGRAYLRQLASEQQKTA